MESNLYLTYFFRYIVFFIFIVITHGGLINLYGHTCGISFMTPSSWFTYVIMTGSQWCKMLNWLTYVTDNIINHIWIYISTFCFGSIISKFLPEYQLPARN